MEIKELLKGCFINVDKPAGRTSHDVDLFLRRELGVDKTSHFGTLDPMVTGVLPMGIGKGVKLFQYIKGGKEYVGTMHIHQDIPRENVEEAIKKHFTGKITQLPPIRSSVKRQERQREVYKFDILEVSEDGKDYLFYVSCEAGTYIRKLCHDLGEHLGVGAHMTELRRTKAGRFDESTLVRLDELMRLIQEWKKGNPAPLAKVLIPKEVILEELRSISVNKDGMKSLSQGGPVFARYLAHKVKVDKDERVGVLYNSQLVAVARVIDNERFMAKPDSVLV